MVFKKKILINLIISIFFSLIIFFLFTHQIIYPTISPMVKNGVANIFADWSAILNANLCKDRLDVYKDNPCDLWNRAHVYGSILLNFPFIKDFIKFYYLIIPIIFNFIFIFVILSFFKFKNKIEYISLLPFIFSIPVLLVIERANIDILIFLFACLIAINKSLFVNYASIILTALSKFYPLIFITIFLFKKNIKYIIINSLILISIVFIILFFEFEDLKKIFINKNQISASGLSAFSFIVSLEYFNNFKIQINKYDYTFVKYLFVFIILIIPMFFLFIKTKKNIFNNYSIQNLILFNNYENRLYILSSLVILVCYFGFKNFLYREIFFLGLVPWILKEKNNSDTSKFINFYYYTLSFKFLFTTIATYLHRNDIVPISKPFVIIGKHCFDFYLILIVLLILMTALNSFFIELFIKKLSYEK